jgi:hypothetical protein
VGGLPGDSLDHVGTDVFDDSERLIRAPLVHADRSRRKCVPVPVDRQDRLALHAEGDRLGRVGDHRRVPGHLAEQSGGRGQYLVGVGLGQAGTSTAEHGRARRSGELGADGGNRRDAYSAGAQINAEQAH